MFKSTKPKNHWRRRWTSSIGTWEATPRRSFKGVKTHCIWRGVRTNPEEIAMSAPVGIPKPLGGLLPGNSSGFKVTRWRSRKKRKKTTQRWRARSRKGQQFTHTNPKPFNERNLCRWQLRRVLSWCPSSLWTMQGTCPLGAQLPRSRRGGG